ncbi:IS4/IS5 family transposase [Streptomyces sp. A1547]|nr:IS4/IS5 family transposase [Streptomyces sp. A1547]
MPGMRHGHTVSKATRGFDAAKKINGRKRHIAVDTLGLPVMITVTPADMTDRDAARELLRRLRVMQPQSPRSGPTPPTPASS